MIEGLTRYCLRALEQSPQQRSDLWMPDLANRELLDLAQKRRRERLQTLIGAVDFRPASDTAAALSFELVTTLERPSVVAQSDQVTVHRVRWPAIAGVSAEGLLLVPRDIRAGVVALPDADWTPEMFAGLADGLPPATQLARRLAHAGCLVAVPTLISRNDEFSGQADVAWTNQPHREFIYRQAFEAGRHIIGYEVQKVLAAVELLQRELSRSAGKQPDERPSIGVVGVGEGALLALHAAALDRRIDSCWVSGHFEQRERVWQEPIYRNIWGLLTEFGDAELAGLIAPRRLVIEACRAVEVTGPPAARPGRSQAAAPGRITTCPLDSVLRERDRAAVYFRAASAEQQLVLAVSDAGSGPPGTDQALTAFTDGLRLPSRRHSVPPAWGANASAAEHSEMQSRLHAERERRQFQELQAHVQGLLNRSHQVRDARWRVNPARIDDWKARLPELRRLVHEDLIGRLPEKRIPVDARSRRILQTAEYTGYEIVLDVSRDMIAGGILLLPANLRPGERRPVVVCQHGLEGVALDTISRAAQPYAYYKAFGEELVKRGFIVYAPQNPYRGGDRFRVLQRMSNPLQRSLYTYIIAQHEQTLDWLTTLPQVDPQRIAFYGLSYGGKTAMRVPPLVESYSLSICSGDFTDWPRSIASNQERFSYLFTAEYEVFEWNLAHVAGYAELAMLMTPRPFMVEEGHRDGGQPSEWVAGEFGKVRRHYDQMGLGDRAVIEFFDGPHTIHGQKTFQFLHQQLRLSAPQTD